ncbi:MAG: ABC transporter permease [Kiritimatiellaeota bacterium]|nr:ABC transporter permease [Kiritimatiellota bacterium]
MFACGYQIAKNTFREILREPIFLLIVLSALVLIGIYPLFTYFVFRQQIKLVVDSAMATTMVFGWVTAVLCASHAIAREIRTGTALLVLAKPVERPVFLIAKILGVLGALGLFWFLCSLASLMAVRIAKDQFRLDYRALAVYFGAIALGCAAGGLRNYLRRSSFPMAAVISLGATVPLAWLIVLVLPRGAEQLTRYAWDMVPALILILYAVCIMGTIATALSTRLELVSNLLVCSTVFAVGLVSDYMLGRFADTSIVARILYCIVPNWQLFWAADALAAKRPIPWGYVGLGAAYLALFAGFFVTLAVILFRDREIGRQEVV